MFTAKGLRFTFPENRVHAVDELDVSFRPGLIHALIGENGAGKSTLARIVAGHTRPSAGSMVFEGKPYAPRNPADALDLGVALVPQHPVLAGELSVWQNLVLGRTCLGIQGHNRFLNKTKTVTGLSSKLDEIGISLPLEQRADSLDTAQVHWTAVAESVLANPRLLILDEPSAPYSHQDIARLYELLRRLADNGATVIVITHKLSEVTAYCDEVHVLRRGKLVAERRTGETNADELQHFMFGQSEVVSSQISTPETNPLRSGTALPKTGEGLSIRALSVDAGPGRVLRGVSADAPRGMITGFLSLKDQGLEALEDILAGILSADDGSCLFDGRPFRSDEKRGYVPSRRFQRGIAPGLTIGDNAIVRSRGKAFPAGVYSASNAKALSASRGFSADRPADHGIITLSGGMIQRVIIERELSLPIPELVICAEPFWGLDTHFQNDLAGLLRSAAAGSAAVCVLSSDIDEAMALCDRIYVLDRGENAGFWEKNAYDRDSIAAAMIHNLHSAATGNA